MDSQIDVGSMSTRELEDYLSFLSKEIQRVVHDWNLLPELQNTMRAVANELSRRSAM